MVKFVGRLALWHHQVEKPKALLLNVHGLGEHSGRHLNTIRHFNSMGFDCVRFDLRGAGQSGGRRQWIENFSDYVEDLNEVFNWVHRTRPHLPIFLLGHSLGGLISIFFAARRSSELEGLLLSAPAFRVAGGVSPLKIKVGKTLNQWFPKLKMPKSTDSSATSRDPAVVEEFERDPLSCHFNTLNQGSEILAAMEKVPEKLNAIHCPTFISHGTSDRIIQLEGSFEIIQRIQAPGKFFFIRPGGYHEAHNDLDKDLYFSQLGLWVGSRLNKKAIRSGQPEATSI